MRDSNYVIIGVGCMDGDVVKDNVLAVFTALCLIVCVATCYTLQELELENDQLTKTIEMQQQIILNYETTDAQQKELIETLTYISEDVKVDIEQIKRDLECVSEWLGKDE